MEPKAPAIPHTLHWMIRGLTLLFAVWLSVLLRFTAHPAPPIALSLAVLLESLALYLWLLDSLIWSASLSVIIFLEFCWVWAVVRSGLFGWLLLAFAILLGTAALSRVRRRREYVHLAQALDNLDETVTEKTHAISEAHRSLEALEKKTARYQRLQSIAETLSHLTDLNAVAQLTVDRAFELIGKSDTCCLLLLDDSRQELSLVACRKRDPAMAVRAMQGDPIDRYLLRTQKPLLVNDIRRDYRFSAPLSQERSVAAIIGCPLVFSGRPEGVLRLDSTQPSVYTQDDLRLLDILLDLAATAINNAKLFAQLQQLAVTDSLTGLSLRRPFMVQFGREILRAVRSREPVSVLMLDVDHFKRYNDAYGHLAGDAVLRSVAELLRQALPAESLIARYGGEEFAVVLPRTNLAQATTLADQVRLLVEQDASRQKIGHRKTEPPPVTLSAGVSCFPADAESELGLIHIADQRLYKAKYAGRNRVCAA